MKVVICGAGIIGASTAYYLALKGIRVTVIERHQPACAASGKAGGFLAADWCDGQPIGTLARTSFKLHMELAEDERFKDCDYRRLDTLFLTVKSEVGGGRDKSELPSWIDGHVTKHSVGGNQETTAQVHPYKLTRAFLDAAKDLVGSEVVIKRVDRIVVDNNKVTGVEVDGEIIPADVVVVAMGPWTSRVAGNLNFRRVIGRRAHSVVLRPSSDVGPHALFVDFKNKNGRDLSPEVYPRPDGTVYICGMGDGAKLPEKGAEFVEVKAESCVELQEMGEKISSCLKGSVLEASQACFLPHTEDYVPMIGKVPGCEGAYIATGHNCWGILNAPATGAAMAELIADGEAKIMDLSAFPVV